jgi:hypothetical protein
MRHELARKLATAPSTLHTLRFVYLLHQRVEYKQAFYFVIPLTGLSILSKRQYLSILVLKQR